jgi:hypothetical protein
VALQFWQGDKEMAMKVARLIADLEPRHSDQADFLFSARFDCTHDSDTVRYVNGKFNTTTHITRNWRGTGWPFGCNQTWLGTHDFIYDQMNAKKMPAYKAILTLEADACPIRPDWIARLSDAWDSAGVKCLGALIPPGPASTGGRHINGNALISGDLSFLYTLTRRIGGCHPCGGYDYLLAPFFMEEGWANCSLIRSHWHTPTATDEFLDRLVKEGAVHLHGVKDESVVNYVRRKYLQKS